MAKIRRTPNRIRKPIEAARKRYNASVDAIYAAAHPRNDVRPYRRVVEAELALEAMPEEVDA